MFPKIKTERSRKFLAFVRSLPCLICQRPGVHAHHTETGGVGIKGSDFSAIPLCPACHSKWHSTTGKHGGFDPEFLNGVHQKLRKAFEFESKK